MKLLNYRDLLPVQTAGCSHHFLNEFEFPGGGRDETCCHEVRISQFFIKSNPLSDDDDEDDDDDLHTLSSVSLVDSETFH